MLDWSRRSFLAGEGVSGGRVGICGGWGERRLGFSGRREVYNVKGMMIENGMRNLLMLDQLVRLQKKVWFQKVSFRGFIGWKRFCCFVHVFCVEHLIWTTFIGVCAFWAYKSTE